MRWLIHRNNHFPAVLPYEATTLADIGFDGDVLHSTGYGTNCGANDARHIVGASSEWTDERRAEASRQWTKERRAAASRRMKEYQRSGAFRGATHTTPAKPPVFRTPTLQVSREHAERLAREAESLALLEKHAPDLAAFVRQDALSVEGALMQLRARVVARREAIERQGNERTRARANYEARHREESK